MTDHVEKSPSVKQVKEALNAVIQSDTFAEVRRLQSFLVYVVEAKLQDSQARIRAKIIAADVYERQPKDGTDQDAVVRVDAGRLRRRLEVYYAKEGASDPVVISIPKGGYAPEFKFRTGPQTRGARAEAAAAVTGASPRRRNVIVAAIGCGGFLLGWAVNELSPRTAQPDPAARHSQTIDPSAEIRLSVNQVSSASLLARTFVEEARQLTFPSIDAARPQAAEVLCTRAIELSPDFAMGHSCAAFVHAFFAFLLPAGADKDARLSQAKRETQIALNIDPADPFSQMASAWTLFAKGSRDRALDQATRAVRLAPGDPFLRNFYGMMMTFHGQPAALLQTPLSGLPDEPPEALYHPFVIAGAKLLTQDYPGAIASIERAIALEGRTSSLITAIHISALENLGKPKEADDLARNLLNTWGIRDIRPRLSRFFSDPSDVAAIAVPVEAVFARIGVAQGPTD